MNCPKCSRENEPGAGRCRVCDAVLPSEARPRVTLAAVDMPMSALVVLMFKLAIAALPVLLLNALIGAGCRGCQTFFGR